MRLKSIEMTGFKSFADRTFVEFGNGITAIVGPNGSGKSNISDAVRWVMGEQSAKSLRSGNMQDVIFSGTQKRKPLGFAEVTLVVDNSDRALKIDFDEVAVTRRVFRSGESEYFINKTAVRMKDVHELFMDTGVGRDGYSIISQGKIAEILSNKPEERRQMFEEASGITKYRYRKEEAQRKLGRTTENIVRLNDIITELENQVGPLKNQSEKAKKYLTLRDELRVLDVNVSLYNIEKHKKTLAEINGIYDNLLSQIDEVNIQVEKIEKDTAAVFENIGVQDEALNQKREELEKINGVRSEYQSDIAILNNRIENNIDGIKRIENEIEELKLKAKELEADITGRGSSDELYDSYNSVQAEIKDVEKKLAEKDETIAAKTSQLEGANTELIEKMNETSELKYRITGNASLKNSLAERAVAIERELSDRMADFNKLNDNLKKAEANLNEKQTEYANHNVRLNNDRAKLDSEKDELELLQKQLNADKNTIAQQKSRLKLLLDLENSFDNYSRSVKSVMNAYNKKELKGAVLYGTVAQLVNVSKKYSVAIETALGGAAQNIVTGTEQDAKAAIAYLKNTKQGRATFLPVSVCKGDIMDDRGLVNEPGYIGIGAKLVVCDSKYVGIVNQLLGRIVVVDNIDNAIKIANKNNHRYRIVTLEGELLAPGGSMSGGSRQQSGGIFSRANELADLQKIIPQNESKLLEDEKKFNDKKDSIAVLSNAVVKAQEQQKELSENLLSLRMEVKHCAEFAENVNAAKSAIEAEKKQLELQLEDIAELDETGNEQIAKLNAEIENYKAAANAHKENLVILENEREKVSAQLLELKMKLGEIKKDIERFNEIEQLSNARKTENELAIERKHENIAEIKENIEGLKDDVEFKNKQIIDLDNDILKLREEIDDGENQRRKLQDSIKAMQEELKKAHESQMNLQQEQSRLDNKKAKSETELENIVNRLWEEYELSLIAAEQVKTEMESVTEATKQISSLKNQIKSLGNINVDSIEEYKAVKERYDFLTSQREDLLKAQSDLESVISEMLEIMRIQFADKFKEISGHFSQIFVELFGGGKGAIKLTDPSNVLESGIDIEVNPPGKAIKSIMQLSGGEQAMVSIALLFSILKVRPAPFCILDEIEAALDDVNVYRFADFLNKNIGKTQYIVVTHRRGTMESANILYGVTMQEKGVTKMLALNIDDVVDAV